jgi:hypothetical protein
MDADEEISVMKIPCVVFCEHEWEIKVVKEGSNGRFDNGRLR